MRPTLSLIVVTHDQPQRLRRFLHSLGKAVAPADVQELIVVENGAEDGPARACLEAAALSFQKRFLFSADPGLSAARNLGLREARSDVVAVFDDDVSFEAQTLTAFADAAARHGRGRFFGGPVRIFGARTPTNWLAPYLPACTTGFDLGDTEKTIEAHHRFLGCAFAAFRNDVTAVGGYPEYLGVTQDYKASGEEVRLQRRLMDAGAVGVYLPGAVVWHPIVSARATPEFALAHFERHHFSQALAALFEAPGAADVNTPRWLYRRRLELEFETRVKILAGAPRARTFPAEMELAEITGRMRGLAMARRLRRSDPANQ